MTNLPWIPIDTSTSDVPTEKRVRGVLVKVILSPYEVPREIRGGYDSSEDRFAIEFRYITEEPFRVIKHDEHLSLCVGRNSGRLFRILIDVTALRAEHVQLQLEIPRLASAAIDALRPRFAKRASNYDLAQRAIEDTKTALTDNLLSTDGRR
jgi:hypothetical protein